MRAYPIMFDGDELDSQGSRGSDSFPEINIPGFRGAFAVLNVMDIFCAEVKRSKPIEKTIADPDIGLLQPIVVKPRSQGDAKYEIVCGRRRYWAFRDNGYAHIPSIITFSGRDAGDLRVLVENMARRPNDKSDVQSLIALLNKGYTVDDLIERMGVSRSDFKSLGLLIRLSPSALSLLRDDKISLTAAKVIAKLGRKAQDDFFSKHQEYTVLNAKKYVSAVTKRQEQITLF